MSNSGPYRASPGINRASPRSISIHSAIPALTGSIVGGATLVEYLFAYPGMGYLLYQSIIANDYTVIEGVVFILVLTTATAVLQ